jgi:4-hydroxy-2-oxoglutarate aldolase
MALANIFPAECFQIQSLVNQGNWQEAEKLYRLLYPVNQAITATYGVAGLKFTADLLGYKGGHVRSPLQPLNISQKEALQEILNQTTLV